MKDYKIIKPRCWICGKKFKVRIRNDGKIVSPCFHSYIRKHFFMGWSYGFKSLKKKDIWYGIKTIGQFISRILFLRY